MTVATPSAIFMSPAKLEQFLQQQIPITKALGARVARADEALVEIHAPLAPNHNHLGTAFGGSLSAVLILTGYAWLYHTLAKRGHSCHVVLKNCHTEYLKPVPVDLHAVCGAPEASAFAVFLAAFEKKGRARLELQSRIVLPDGQAACVALAEFVAIKN